MKYIKNNPFVQVFFKKLPKMGFFLFPERFLDVKCGVEGCNFPLLTTHNSQLITHNSQLITHFLQSFRVERLAMHRRKTLPADGVQVRLGAVSCMFFKAITRVFLGQAIHIAVTKNLRKD